MTRRYLIVGLVQGVGYRAHARRAARSLGVTGYARNLADGSVEVEATGSVAALDQLEGALRSGPLFGRVDRISSLEISLELAPPTTFDIR